VCGPRGRRVAEIGRSFTELHPSCSARCGARPVWGGVGGRGSAPASTRDPLPSSIWGNLSVVARSRLARRQRQAVAPHSREIAVVDGPSCTYRSNGGAPPAPTGARCYNERLDAKNHGVMAFKLWFGVLAFTIVTSTCIDRRIPTARLEEDPARGREGAAGDRPRRVGAADVMSSRARITGWRSPSPSSPPYWVWIGKRTKRRRAGGNEG